MSKENIIFTAAVKVIFFCLSRYYALTQLRPVFARRLLPCLDEPRHKALFSLRVWRLPQYIARSNMPLVDTSPRRYFVLYNLCQLIEELLRFLNIEF